MPAPNGGKKFALPLLLVLLAVALALQGCAKQGSENFAPGKVNVSASAYEINEGGEITIEAFSADQSTTKLTITFGFEKKSVQCNGQCSVGGKFKPEAGLYSLSAEAETPGGTLKSAQKTVVVNRALLSCVDGTAFGSCARNLPWTCEFGILWED